MKTWDIEVARKRILGYRCKRMIAIIAKEWSYGLLVCLFTARTNFVVPPKYTCLEPLGCSKCVYESFLLGILQANIDVIRWILKECNISNIKMEGLDMML